jgi:hypothetical protein
MAEPKKPTVGFKSDESGNPEASVTIGATDFNNNHGAETELLNKKVNINLWQDVCLSI